MSDRPRVDLDRLREDLLALGKIGADPVRTGVNRTSFSTADMDARRWLMTRMEDAGLATQMDGAGNVVGRWETGSGGAVLIGSHLDSVPQGGLFDGSLGVCAGLECVRALMDAGRVPPCPIEIVATSDEEGRFGGMLGSQAICGALDRDWLESARDETGFALADALRNHGLSPASALEARRAPETVRAFLELHIEQGPVLASSGDHIGVVEGISGVFNWSVTLMGVPNHAGTTPMDLRHDAFMGLADFSHQIPSIIAAVGTEQTRLTVGRVDVEPNFPHTIPGRVDFSLIGRDMSKTVMSNLASACRQALVAHAESHGLQMDIEPQSWLPPAPCDPGIAATFRKCARAAGYRVRTMPSGAGHDTQIMSSFTRAGMIFVPSVGGISHSPEEWTEWADVERGTSVLLATLSVLCDVDGEHH